MTTISDDQLESVLGGHCGSTRQLRSYAPRHSSFRGHDRRHDRGFERGHDRGNDRSRRRY